MIKKKLSAVRACTRRMGVSLLWQQRKRPRITEKLTETVELKLDEQNMRGETDSAGRFWNGMKEGIGAIPNDCVRVQLGFWSLIFFCSRVEFRFSLLSLFLFFFFYLQEF